MVNRVVRRASAAAVALLGGVTVVASPTAAAEPTTGVRVDLRVLVLTNNGIELTVVEQLAHEGVPYTLVHLDDPARPVIDDGFLRDTVDTGPRARFQAVVLPDEAPVQLTGAELDALRTYERDFDVRQVDAYTWSHPGVGLNHPVDPGYLGSLDGMTARVTEAGLAGPFRYLRGPVPFDTGDPGRVESFGHLSTPLPDDPAAGKSFTTLVGMTIPGTEVQGSVLGVYRHDGREELVGTAGGASSLTQFRALAPGIVDWMTRGVHLGLRRNTLAVQIDDVFLAEPRWNVAEDCHPGGGCPDGGAPPIRMRPEDVEHLLDWQRDRGLALELGIVGDGSEDHAGSAGADPLLASVRAAGSRLRLVNHLYRDADLGCVRETSGCRLDPVSGEVLRPGRAEIQRLISRNRAWALLNGLALDPWELVAEGYPGNGAPSGDGGDDSGSDSDSSGDGTADAPPATAPAEDNPAVAAALDRTGIIGVGLDAGADRPDRIGSAVVVQRHSLGLSPDVATLAEAADELTWRNSPVDRGGGACAGQAGCPPPVTADTFDTVVVPRLASAVLDRVMTNDPRPTHAHQAHLSEDRLALRVLDTVLQRYRTLHAVNTPLVSRTLTGAALELSRRARWEDDAGAVTAYTLDGRLYLDAPRYTAVPVTVPAGTTMGSDAFGSHYAGAQSAWTGAGTSGAVLRLGS